MQDLEDRLAFGIGKYGVPLQAMNGRDALRDTYEELLDACCYLRQVIEESRNPADGTHTSICETCQGQGFVEPRRSMVSYVSAAPSLCPVCDGNGWVRSA
jgi:excinuclease UvrABC ATPase subunit